MVMDWLLIQRLPRRRTTRRARAAGRRRAREQGIAARRVPLSSWIAGQCRSFPPATAGRVTGVKESNGAQAFNRESPYYCSDVQNRRGDFPSHGPLGTLQP